jgi:7-cyano-7-deazaguanine synthase
MNKRAVILLSGGLDSATLLAMAKEEGFECYALSVSYGQRHHAELSAAQQFAERWEVPHRIAHVDIDQWGGSALTSSIQAVPTAPSQGIPVTYVPARNTIMLALALSWAEVLEASSIFIGVNAADRLGYPDCRPEYIQAFQHCAQLATKAGVEGTTLTIRTPLQELNKSEIIKKGMALGVNVYDTVSCYQATDLGLACGQCDACRLRKQGFLEAGLADHTRYRQ